MSTAGSERAQLRVQPSRAPGGPGELRQVEHSHCSQIILISALGEADI